MKIIKSCLLLAIAFTICSAGFAQTKDKDQDRDRDKDQQRAQALKIINGPRVEGTGDSWAVIAWTTNTGGSSILRYGTDKNNLNETAEAPYADNEASTKQTHRIHLKNLKPNTTYYYMVDSGQGEGTGTEAKSPVSEFHTK